MNWQTWKAKGDTYLAVDRGDGWHITRQDGQNYGAWRNVQTFRKLQKDNDPNGFLGLPGTVARLSIRVSDSQQNFGDSITGFNAARDANPANPKADGLAICSARTNGPKS